MPVPICNLVFPAYVPRLDLDGYSFSRVHDYQAKVLLLHHSLNSFNEFQFHANFGTHAVTAEATGPEPEPSTSLGWGDPTKTRLEDILLVLSLFTMRNVWVWEVGSIVGEHREYQYGTALQGQMSFIDGGTGGMRIDIGFEPAMNHVLHLIRTPKWNAFYEKGRLLMMANHAFRWQILETTFSLCWTIWEHVFALHNRRWLDKKNLKGLSGREKISFNYHHYALERYWRPMTEQDLARLPEIRNRLIHFGGFADEASTQQAQDFVRWTQYLIAAILCLRGGAYASVELYQAAQSDLLSAAFPGAPDPPIS